jgi:hypothetical protein
MPGLLPLQLLVKKKIRQDEGRRNPGRREKEGVFGGGLKGLEEWGRGLRASLWTLASLPHTPKGFFNWQPGTLIPHFQQDARGEGRVGLKRE